MSTCVVISGGGPVVEPPAETLPTGGTTGQVLTKVSDTDFDVDWEDATGGGSGAPTTAHYLTSQAEAGLSAEVNLGALTSGLLKHTVSGGVSTPATAVSGTDYEAPGAAAAAQSAAEAYADAAAAAAQAASQPLDSDLTTIAGLTATSDNFIQAKSSAWASRTVAQVITDLVAAGGAATANQKIGSIAGVFDGGGQVLVVGSKVRVRCPYAGTITGATLLLDVSDTVSIEVRKCTYAQYDGGSTHPVTGDKISASAPIATSAAIKAQPALTGWTTAVSAGDIIELYLSSVAAATWAFVQLDVTKS